MRPRQIRTCCDTDTIARVYLEADGGPERFKLFSDLNRQLTGWRQHKGEVRLRTSQQHLRVQHNDTWVTNAHMLTGRERGQSIDRRNY